MRATSVPLHKYIFVVVLIEVNIRSLPLESFHNVKTVLIYLRNVMHPETR